MEWLFVLVQYKLLLPFLIWTRWSGRSPFDPQNTQQQALTICRSQIIWKSHRHHSFSGLCSACSWEGWWHTCLVVQWWWQSLIVKLIFNQAACFVKEREFWMLSCITIRYSIQWKHEGVLANKTGWFQVWSTKCFAVSSSLFVCMGDCMLFWQQTMNRVVERAYELKTLDG